MDYRIDEDLLLIRQMLEISQDEIASFVGLDQKTISRIENHENIPFNESMEKIYDFAYRKGIKLNKIKEYYYKENNPNQKIIFHGSKLGIKGNISPHYGRLTNDFGKGFYCGESMEQSISYVAKFPKSSNYIICFDESNELKRAVFNVDLEWMLAVAYFRERIDDYKYHPLIKKIIKKVTDADYINAPIADNRVFKNIDRFIDGEITDVQCKHCLAATNLGNQYVFLTEKATSHLTILEKCFIPKSERDHYLSMKENDLIDSDNKVKFAVVKYKRQGKYIEEILK